MTGFASDVDHLVSTVQSSADRHRLVYEGSDHVPSPLRLVHELAEALYDNAQGTQAGRPFGVQCLIVGQVPDWRPRFGIFTLDPSGGYRHWGVATAIGRGADRVRRNVYEQLQAKSGSRSGSSSSGDVPRTADEALRLALNATMVAFASDAPPSSSTASAAKTAAPNEDYAALLLLAAAASSSTTDADKIEPEMGIVDPNHLQALVQELREPWNAARA
jgi:20S proteasome alpha/beta subunit